MRKRILAFMLCALICFGFSGCGKSDEKLTDTGETTVSVPLFQQETSDVTTSEAETTEAATELTTEAVTTEVTVTEETTTSLWQSGGNGTDGATVTPPAPEDKKESYNGSTPLLYKVTDNKGHCVWLFGSIHVGREDYYPLPDYVYNAFDMSDALAVEIDVKKFEKNYLAQIISLKKLTYNDNTTIKDHLPEKTYNQAVEILKENGMYSESMESYKPVLWSNFIDNNAIKKLGAASEYGVDVHLIARANDLKKPILQIETAGQQYGMLGSFSEALQVLMLQSSVNSYGQPEKVKADLDEMMDMWYKGDETEFTSYLARDSKNDNEVVAALMEEYNKAMFTDRNKKMTDYAVRQLRKGKKVFICVGAAHVIGDDGMVKRLRDLGYKVEAVR